MLTIDLIIINASNSFTTSQILYLLGAESYFKIEKKKELSSKKHGNSPNQPKDW